MNKKIRILVVFLGLISLLAAGLAAWIYLSAQEEINRYAKVEAELSQQNTYLKEELDSAKQRARQLQEKADSVSAALERLSEERNILLGQANSLSEEKNLLIAENRKLQQELERIEALYAQAEEKAQQDKSDQFLTALLEEKAKVEAELERLKSQSHFQKLEANEEKMAQMEKDKKALEEKIASARSLSGNLSSDLLGERKKRVGLEEELAKVKEQLEQLMRERDELSAQLGKMKQAVEERLEELDKTKQVLKSAVEETAKQTGVKKEATLIQLAPIVVKAEDEQARASTKFIAADKKADTFRGLKGRIITVNDKHKFVVIDLGKSEGVEKAMQFDVYRKKKRIGKIEVIETRQTISACDIKEMSRRIKVDDIVRR